MTNADAAQADRSFHAALAEILAEPKGLAKYPPARRDYVAFAHAAMGWWIDQGKAGAEIAKPADKAPRDRIILAWAAATGAPTMKVRRAIAAQEDSMRRNESRARRAVTGRR